MHICHSRIIIEKKKVTPDYWKSFEGIVRRCEMLAESLTFQVVNGALQAFGKESKIKAFVWVTVKDDNVCDICKGYHGNYYRLGQFLPSLPAHAGCRCGWELIPREEK